MSASRTTTWLTLAALASGWSTGSLFALSPAPQAGDKEGEEQPMVDRNFDVPAAPALSVEEALASFTLPEGYRIECVASDPLIHDPVDIAFDERSRMWVVEMTTLMQDADGSDELEPSCAIAVLTDTDGDGVYDARQNFAEELVLPRSVCFVDGGVLAILPPEIVFLQDTDGDGVADTRERVDQGITAGLSNPEHAANALTRSVDGWIYLANHNKRYRRVAGEWQSEAVPVVGQWGLGQDDWGRRIYNYNSAPVHGDLVPTHYLVRNGALGRASGSNAKWAQDTRVWPGRVNTGVNRGYQRGTLAEDGRLARYTAACGPEVFTGTRLAPGDRGDVFVCEPSGNLIRQLDLRERDGRPQGENAYAVERSEFLLSTDERFRPVNLRNGPDGALYVVDLYRGILQHRVFLTSFLRRQIEERGLDKPIGLGRIYRVVHESTDESEPAGRVDWSQQSAPALVQALHEPNAWTRHTAQRLLVDHHDATPELIAALQQVAEDDGQPLAQLHAAWTLHGLHAVDPAWLVTRLRSEAHAKVLANLVRISEAQATTPAVRQAWQWLVDHPAPEVRWQLAHSLGEVSHPAALGQMVQLLARHADDGVLRAGVLSGLAGREGVALDRVLLHPGLARQSDDRNRVVRELARCLTRRADPQELRLLTQRMLRSDDAGLRLAMAQGMADGVPKNPGDRRYRFTVAEPAAMIQLAAEADGELAKKLEHVRARLSWSAEAQPERSLPAAHLAAVARGAQVYAASCGTCHQADGEGLAGLAPPLAESEWLAKPNEELANIALFGLSGPIQVRGETWDMSMPGWAHLSDDELADVLTYVTTEWGPEPRHVASEVVTQVRRQP